ncbi:putative ribonuclease H-like domain-containing protein [Tanacetum coccineum]
MDIWAMKIEHLFGPYRISIWEVFKAEMVPWCIKLLQMCLLKSASHDVSRVNFHQRKRKKARSYLDLWLYQKNYAFFCVELSILATTLNRLERSILNWDLQVVSELTILSGKSFKEAMVLSKRNQDSRRIDAWNTGNKTKDNGRRSEDEQENYALMAYINSRSDTEVTSCSKECKESYAKLKKLYDEQREQLGDASIEIQAYTQALKKVEAQLVAHQQNQLWYKEKITFMKIYLDDKTDVLTYHKKLLAKAEKEKKELKTKVEKWHNSSKSLNILLNSQMSVRDKAGFGYGDQMSKGVLSYENEVFGSLFNSGSSDIEDSPVNDRYAEGMHAVPPPMTGIYIPSGPDKEIDESQFTYGPKQSKPSESDARRSDFNSCESNSSEETNESISKPYESDSDDEHVSLPTKEHETPTFAFINTVKHVKTPRQTVKEQNTCSQSPKPAKKDCSGLMSKKLGLGYGFTKKACFVCGSFSHLIRDCDFHEKRMAKQAELNKRMITGRIQVNTARASSANNVNTARHNFNSQAVPTNTARKDYPQRALKNKWIVDSGCSRHMTGNKAYLAEYQDYNGGPVAFGGSKGYITGKDVTRRTRPVDQRNQQSRHVGSPKKLIIVQSTIQISEAKNEGKKPNKNTDLKTNEKPVDQEDQVFLDELERLKRQEKEANDAAETIRKEFPKILRICFFKQELLKLAVLTQLILLAHQIHSIRAWYATLSTFLLKSGYRRGTIDKTLFIKKDKNDIMLVQVYVDDIIFGSTKRSWCDEFEALMKSRFQMSSMGELTFFLGLQVKQKEDGIFISQDKYVAEILKKFDFASVKTASTPIETQKPLVKDEEATDVDVHLYRSMIGSLMYLTASRPDIMFAVCACSRFQVTPKTSHLNAVKRIFRYLKGKPKLGLWYPRVSSFDLEAYSDSDYAGANLDRKSTTGGCQFLSRRLISWQCKKQTIVATSTTEAEYVAAANCCGQVLWIQNQMLDYGFNFMNTKIYIDNESTICIVKNPVFHSKTKHIEIRHHFIRDAYEKKLIQVLKIHTDDNVADLLTKAFDVSSAQKDLDNGDVFHKVI